MSSASVASRSTTCVTEIHMPKDLEAEAAAISLLYPVKARLSQLFVLTISLSIAFHTIMTGDPYIPVWTASANTSPVLGAATHMCSATVSRARALAVLAETPQLFLQARTVSFNRPYRSMIVNTDLYCNHYIRNISLYKWDVPFVVIV